MIRASTDPSAPEFTVHMTGEDRGLKVKYRSSAGWSTASINGPSLSSVPVWLRLVKNGNTVLASYSNNGTDWSSIGTAQTIDGIDSNYLYGMTVVSNSADDQASAIFEVSDLTKPSVTTFRPASGAVGTAVIINGSSFVGVSQVAFAGEAATFIPVSDTQLVATVPEGAMTGKIAITAAGGTGASSNDFVVTKPNPAITDFDPSSGPVGTPVTIYGTDLAGATEVTFDGMTAMFMAVSANQIMATVPEGATTGKISVITAGGTAISETDFVVTAPAPTISGFDPGSGPEGTIVTIEGTDFTGASEVTFNDASAMFRTASANQILATVPPAATSGKISVTTPGGTVTSTADFVVVSVEYRYLYLPAVIK